MKFFMSSANVIIAHPKNETQKNALKAVMEALGIKFEEDKPYNKAFVAKIKESRKQREEGKVTRIPLKELDNFLGLK
jgi:predicted adenine nucleotide alpha hydrolase (AANH) superfamily ATPase